MTVRDAVAENSLRQHVSTYAKAKNVACTCLRECDEVVLHEGCAYTDESLCFKNTAFRLSGDAPSVPANLFSPDWCHGVSGVVLNSEAAARLNALAPNVLQARVEALAKAVNNDLVDHETQVGASLSVDGDRDTESWVAGFDSSSCCVGLYATDDCVLHDGAPEGSERVHRCYWLMCKAGAGVAAQEFSARLDIALKDAMSLNQCLAPGAEPGDEGLRRVASAARRNRARVLHAAAVAFGIDDCIDMVMDNTASFDSPLQRHVMLDVDAPTNMLVPLHLNGIATTDWLYCAGCLHTPSTHGIVSCANAAAGFVLIRGAAAVRRDERACMRNAFYDTVPFGSTRLRSNGEAVADALSRVDGHADNTWLRDTFYWRSPFERLRLRFGDVEASTLAKTLPVQLWGTHGLDQWLESTGALLGVSGMHVSRLRPVKVLLAGTEPGKLRRPPSARR